MNIELVYIDSSQPLFYQQLKVEANTTVSEALQRSSFSSQHPNVSLEDLVVGIYSDKVHMEHLLQPGDRIEIYRPLSITPMEKRRLLAKRRARSS